MAVELDPKTQAENAIILALELAQDGGRIGPMLQELIEEYEARFGNFNAPIHTSRESEK